MKVTKEDLKHVEFNRLMEAFPAGVAMMREHGRWVIFRDRPGKSVPLYEQKEDQSFEDFVIEFVAGEMNRRTDGEYGFLDIVIEITLAMARYKKYRNRLNREL